MAIMDKTYFRPKSQTDIRKYYSQEERFGSGAMLTVSYYSFETGLEVNDALLFVGGNTHRSLSIYDMNEVQFEYAIAQFQKLVSGYSTQQNSNIAKRIVMIGNAIIDLRNWLADFDGIPKCYFDVNQYFSIYDQPSIVEVDELISLVYPNSTNFRSKDGEADPSSSDANSQHLEFITNKLKHFIGENKILKRNNEMLRKGYTDSEIELIADQSRFQNGNLNFTKFGELLGITRQTAKKLIDKNNLGHLKTPPS